MKWCSLYPLSVLIKTLSSQEEGKWTWRWVNKRVVMRCLSDANYKKVYNFLRPSIFGSVPSVGRSIHGSLDVKIGFLYWSVTDMEWKTLTNQSDGNSRSCSGIFLTRHHSERRCLFNWQTSLCRNGREELFHWFDVQWPIPLTCLHYHWIFTMNSLDVEVVICENFTDWRFSYMFIF